MDVATHRCIRLARGRIDERVEDLRVVIGFLLHREDGIGATGSRLTQILPSKRRWTIDEEDLVKAIASGKLMVTDDQAR